MIYRRTTELWTPNGKTRRPSPVCRRCGGLEQLYYMQNYHRLGSMFHRACCCKPPTPVASCDGLYVAVTFAGVDAALCSQCMTDNFIGSPDSFKVENLTLDGTYGPFGPIDVSPSTFNTPLAGTNTDWTLYDTTNCQTVVASGGGVLSLAIHTICTEDPFTVGTRVVSATISTGAYGVLTAFDFFNGGGEPGLDVTVNNGLFCNSGFGGGYTNGGTAHLVYST